MTATTVLAQLRAKRDQILELDTAISAKIQVVEELEEETCNADTYQATLEEHIALLTELLRKSTQAPSRPPTSPTPPASPPPDAPLPTDTPDTEPTVTEPLSGDMSTTHTHVTTSSAHQNARLPKLTLPTFNGEPLQWETFWDSFDAAVNSNTGLSDVQKFNYLRAQVHGDAARVIAGFPLTDSNYAHSVALLRERFGQTYKLVNAHMEALLNLGKPSNTLPSLQAFHDSIEQHMRALSSLGRSSESYGPLLTSSILSKLPTEIKKHMARERPNSEWTIEEVLTGMLKEIQIFEMSQQYNGKPNGCDSIVPTTGSFYTATDTPPHSHDRHQTERKEPVCVFCKGGHKAIKCNVVTDPKERLAIVKRDKLCYNCLARHKASRCSSRFTCKECKKRHHTSLCQSFAVEQAPPQNTPDQPSQQALTTVASTPTYFRVCLLKTAIAQVSSPTVTTEGNILFDEGAQRSFITQALAKELQLQPTHRENISVSSFGAQVSSSRNMEVASVFIHTLSGSQISISVLIVPQLAAPIQNAVRTCLRDIPYLQGLPLAHPVTGDENFDISILIGADYYWQFIQDNIIRGNGPTAVKSHLGYLLSGPLPLPKPIKTTNLHVAILSCTTNSTDSCCPWKSEFTDTMSSADTMTNAFFQHYMQTHITAQPDGGYSLRFPWKEGHQPLPSNYTVCSRRTRSLAHRLAKTPELMKHYGKIIDEQERRGFIEKVDDHDHKKNVHYIPHHPVKKESSTTPIRIVYDCSCKQTTSSPSLNDCLHAGPPSLNDLCAILLRFRLHKFAFSADIEKAFLHVHLDESDRDYTRFFMAIRSHR